MLSAVQSTAPEAPAALADADLLAGARRLEARALAAVHDRYYPDLYRYLLYRTNDEHAAEDMASEVFMRLLDGLHRGKPPENLPAWLFGVASHLAADYFRRQARRPETPLGNATAAPDSQPEDIVETRLKQAAVRRALAELTEEQQRVLALRFGEGRSLEHAAQAMQKSVTAVKQLQFRAVAALRRRLDGAA